MILILTFLTLLAVTIANYFIFGKSICSPPFMLCLGFAAASADLLTMVDYWKVSLHWNTYMVICGGCVLFSAVCLIVRFLMNSFRTDLAGKLNLSKLPRVKGKLEISRFKLLGILAFNLLVILLLSYKVIKITRMFGYHGGILGSFGQYARLVKFTNKSISLGKINLLYNICRAGGYIWGNLLVIDYFKKKKINLLLLACFTTTVLSTFITGSRGGSVYMMLSLLPSIYLCRERRFFKKPLKFRYILLLCVLAIGALFSFQFLGAAIGRTMREKVTPWAYASIYLGAPIQNLDYFLQTVHKAPKIFGSTTFYYQIQNYAVSHNIPSLIYEFDLPFMSYNGHNAGNVFTMFYSFYYDFGYKGIVVLTGIMALIVQVIYELMIKSIKKSFSFSRLLYLYEFPFIPLSFFSNKFYEGLNEGFLKLIIFWIFFYLVIIQNTYRIKLDLKNKVVICQNKSRSN